MRLLVGLQIRTRFKRYSFIGFIAVVFLGLCWLGTWQLQRAAYKESLFARLSQEVSRPPLHLEKLSTLATLSQQHDEFKLIHLEGQWLPTYQRVIGPKTWDGKTGVHLYIPFRLRDQTILWVNTGWWDEKSPLEGLPSALCHITIRLRWPIKPNVFTPDNRPPQKWFWPELSALPSPPGTWILHYGERVEHAPVTTYPRPLPFLFSSLPPQQHVFYAIIWYSIALIIGGMCFIFIKRYWDKG